MKLITPTILLALMALCVSCGRGTKSSLDKSDAKDSSLVEYKTYICEDFTVSYPADYFLREGHQEDGPSRLIFSKDSLDKNTVTILWESPGKFPGNESQFVYLFTYKEMEAYKKSNTFYDIMKIDSIYLINGFPTYTITSVYEEGVDTIIQTRSGVVFPNQLDMMVIERMNSKMSKADVKVMDDILGSIKFNIKYHE